MKATQLIKLFSCLSLCLGISFTNAQTVLTQQQKWEEKIQRYERLDKQNPPPDNVILFVGSSTIENWKTLKDDFVGRAVLNRGVSGTKTIDLYTYRDRLITPYNAKQIFIYEGDNDIGLHWPTDRIVAQFAALFSEIRKTKPHAEIIYISIKPSPRRLKDKIQIEEVNVRIKQFLEQQSGTAYADVYSKMLDVNGDLVSTYYREDGLHLTAEGYTIWKDVISKFIK
ncbi:MULTISPECIES: GDSL-type esterase/lipase family protein [Sphingobacterium]|uniref:SGNH/GDSL hydrolase family protein n=1 Tax=Sphingobacterium ginsenosidimutans TaxID=687845 RepID=A0ABP8AK34_9SPHI|nr:GDSL-type esterase/lipase family protein [Sphingobacterium sp. E70]ULT22687.1 GDSL-type esterase/lipase family protein [Sphingobacterium sp. E70]